MAYIITAVGAGGKTTWLTTTGRRLLAEGKKVAMTTTTHIWAPKTDAENGIRYFGTPAENGKLSAPDDVTWERVCREYDVVLVEGDGSRCMPVKIPNSSEPVIPADTDEIVIVMGKHALGREIGTVCHRFDTLPEKERPCAPDTPVTEKLLREIAARYYEAPLSAAFPHARIRYFLSDMSVSGLDADVKKMTLVLLASGFGVRFGGNKLLEPVGGKRLYEKMLDRLLSVSGRIKPAADVLVVTQYGEILEAVQSRGERNLSVLQNGSAAEGISASVRLGTEKARESGSDAVAFFAADMPRLPEEDILRFVNQFLFSGKTCACMQTAEKSPEGKTLYRNVNPGAFRLGRRGIPEELMALQGDRGAMKIIRARPEECGYYQIEPEKVRDIDRREDMYNL